MKPSYPLAAAAACLSLAACATGPNPLDVSTRDGVFVKDATLKWEVKDQGKSDDTNYVAGRDDMMKRLETAVEQEFKSSPSGADPIVFEIDVKSYNRFGAAASNIIGLSNMVTADVKVMRASDRKELGVYKNVAGIYATSGGLLGAVAQSVSKPDVVGIMANNFSSDLRRRFDKKK